MGSLAQYVSNRILEEFRNFDKNFQIFLYLGPEGLGKRKVKVFGSIGKDQGL